MHGRARLLERLRGGVEHLLRVGDVAAHPQRDAAGEERDGLVALEHVHLPIRVFAKNGIGGENAGVGAADNGEMCIRDR